MEKSFEIQTAEAIVKALLSQVLCAVAPGRLHMMETERPRGSVGRARPW